MISLETFAENCFPWETTLFRVCFVCSIDSRASARPFIIFVSDSSLLGQLKDLIFIGCCGETLTRLSLSFPAVVCIGV